MIISITNCELECDLLNKNVFLISKIGTIPLDKKLSKEIVEAYFKKCGGELN